MQTASADMFEMGVKVQVVKKGTMLGVRANQLFDLYKRYNAIDELPESIQNELQKNLFKASFETIWTETKAYFEERNPAEIDRAIREPKYKMLLIFRWYLGKSRAGPAC